MVKRSRTSAALSPAMKRVLAAAKETGYVDVAAANYACDTTGSITLLNTVAQGAAVTERVGKKIVMKGLQCRGTLGNASTATYNDVAYIIVYDKRPTGVLPAISDILVSVNPESMNNDNNSGRFSILKRVDANLVGNLSFTGAVANALCESTVRDADWWLNLKGLEVVYKAAGTGAISDIEQGALSGDCRQHRSRHGRGGAPCRLSSAVLGHLR